MFFILLFAGHYFEFWSDMKLELRVGFLEALKYQGTTAFTSKPTPGEKIGNRAGCLTT
jgi:hypothetical protein